MLSIVQNNRNSKYLDIWRNVFNDETIKSECKNVLHVFEIMLITPFTNAKVERIFSKMNRIKTDTRNRLSRSRLDVCLRVGEEGKSVENFDPNPVIGIWFADRVRRLNSGPHKYKRVKDNEANGMIDIAKLTMSDLEESEEEIDFE